MFHSTYCGVNIYRADEPGYRLRWTAISPRLAADTLEGLKALIRDHQARKGA